MGFPMWQMLARSARTSIVCAALLVPLRPATTGHVRLLWAVHAQWHICNAAQPVFLGGGARPRAPYLTPLPLRYSIGGALSEGDVHWDAYALWWIGEMYGKP